MKLKKRIALSLRNSLRFIPDEAYMKMCFKVKLRYEPDFEHPKTFNEKIQWSKLHYHNPDDHLHARRIWLNEERR